MSKRQTAKRLLTGCSLTKASKPLPRSVLRGNRRFSQTLGRLAHNSPHSGTVICHMTNARDVIAPELSGFFHKPDRPGKGQEPLKWWLKILPTANDKVVALAAEWHEIHPALTRHCSDAKASIGFPIADSQGEFGLTPYRRAKKVEGGRIEVLLPQEMLEQETTAGAFLACDQAYSTVVHVHQVSNVVRIASGDDQALFAPGPFDQHHVEVSQGTPGNGPVIISRVWVKDV